MVHLSPQGFHNRSFTIRPLQYFLLIVLLTGSATVALAQSRQTDSLSRLIATAPHDTLKCRILSLIAESEGDDNIWPLYNKQLLDLAESNLSKPTTAKNPLLHRTYSRFKADALNNVGFLHYVQGQFDKALEFYYRSLDIREKINDQTGIASSLSNIGVIYQNQGKMNKVMEVYERGLAIQKKVGDKRGAGISLNNIGFLHLNQGDIAKALDYFRQTLSLQEELGNKDLQAGALNNIGKALETQNENEEALRMFEKGKKLHQEANNKAGVAECLINISLIHIKKGDTLKALQNNFEALQLQKQVNNFPGMGYALANIGRIYMNWNRFDSAGKYITQSIKVREFVKDKRGLTESYYNLGWVFYRGENMAAATVNALKSLQYARELGYPADIRNSSALLYRIYKKTGNTKDALAMYELYSQMRDSINNEEVRRSTIKSQLKYEYEKKAAADSVKVAEEKKLSSAQLKYEQNQRYALYGGLALTAVFGVFMFNRFRVTRKQKNIIEEQKLLVEKQKHLVEEKQKEVMDSIHYARRIQRSLLTTERYIAKSLNRLNGKF